MLMTFKKILCPTDFSEASRLAIDVAADLAARDNGELCLVNIVEVEPPLPSDPNFVMEVPEYERTLHADAQRQLDALAACLNNMTVQTVIGHGDPGREIVRIAQEEAADLIVMPTHGRTGLDHVVFGRRKGGAACTPAGPHDAGSSEALKGPPPPRTLVSVRGCGEALT